MKLNELEKLDNNTQRNGRGNKVHSFQNECVIKTLSVQQESREITVRQSVTVPFSVIKYTQYILFNLIIIVYNLIMQTFERITAK